MELLPNLIALMTSGCFFLVGDEGELSEVFLLDKIKLLYTNIKRENDPNYLLVSGRLDGVPFPDRFGEEGGDRILCCLIIVIAEINAAVKSASSAIFWKVKSTTP